MTAKAMEQSVKAEIRHVHCFRLCHRRGVVLSKRPSNGPKKECQYCDWSSLNHLRAMMYRASLSLEVAHIYVDHLVISTARYTLSSL